MSILRKKSIKMLSVIVAFCLFCISNLFALPSQHPVRIGDPNWYADLDAGGFSDAVYYGHSPDHPYGYHELLSGEIAVAVFYDGIADNKSMWLTDQFLYPNWPTDSNFIEQGTPGSWDNASNPAVPLYYYGNWYYDTGQSIVQNNKLRVTIDYEIAKLPQGSPMVFREQSGNIDYVRSDRSVLLKTYTVKNISAAPLANVKIFEFLHSHGADEYNAAVSSTYQTNSITDPLANYEPKNSVHKALGSNYAGNFRYDITQWNNLDIYPHEATHVDWVSISSTIEPDYIENGHYRDGHYSYPNYKPASGTHINIENCSLNGITAIYNDEVGGALGWNLETLAVNEEKKITVAFMFGRTEHPDFPTILTKSNADPNNDCVVPYSVNPDYLTYDICYDANGFPISGVVITDELPLEVDYYSSDPAGTYDSNSHTVTWHLPDLSENDANCIELVTKVNNYARPCSTFTNKVEMESNGDICGTATADVNVCYFGGEILYVDNDANGFGTSWEDAFKELRDATAIAELADGAVTAIWVAGGTYKPIGSIETGYQDATFNLPENVALIGHFAGNETDPNQRNLSDPNNETILEGKIGTSESEAVKYVVKATGVNNAGLIDGFTIQGSYGLNTAGIYLNDSNMVIVNCKVKNNDDWGIYVYNHSTAAIHNCLFKANTTRGIYAYSYCNVTVSNSVFDKENSVGDGIRAYYYNIIEVVNCLFKNLLGGGISITTGGRLTVSDCTMMYCGGIGVYASSCDIITVDRVIIEYCGGKGLLLSSTGLTLRNSVIQYNAEDGLNLSSMATATVINNWINNNGYSGIYLTGSGSVPIIRNNTIYGNTGYGMTSGYSGSIPDIRNCIIYANYPTEFSPIERFTNVNYCNLQSSHDGDYNKTGDPGFISTDVDLQDLHLNRTSQCIDAGDPNVNYGSETDINGETRVRYGRADIGADEFSGRADFDESEFVNFVDYAILASAWQTDSGDPNYNEDCDLVDNNSIDPNDLVLFCEDWLWQAPWFDKQILLATDFTGGIPAGWTVEDGYSDTKTWTTSNPGSRSNANWTGTFCIVDSSWYGLVDMNECLITPVLDCSGTVEVLLKFSHWFRYRTSGYNEKGDVDISINNGPWQTIIQYTTESSGTVNRNISDIAAGQSNVRIRWHYYNARSEYWWGIDNIKVIGNYRTSGTQGAMMDDGQMTAVMSEGEMITMMAEQISEATIVAKPIDSLKITDFRESHSLLPKQFADLIDLFYAITPESVAAWKAELEASATSEAVLTDCNCVRTYTVGSGEGYDFSTINDAIAAISSCTLTAENRGTIQVYPGTYVEQLNSFYPGGYNLPAHCDLIGMGDEPSDVVIKHKRRAETDPNFTNIAAEIYAAGISCGGDNQIRNIKLLNDGPNQNSVKTIGHLELSDCIIVSYHDAVTASGHLTIDGCEIEGWYRPCVHAYSTFDIRNTAFYPKTRNWGGQHPAGIKAYKSGVIDNVTITAEISSSDYEPHYDTPWLAGVIAFLSNANDKVTVSNTTIDLTLTTITHEARPNETAAWQVFGVVSGGRNPSPTTYYPGTVDVNDCEISVNGIENGRGILVGGVVVRGGGTVNVLGNTKITTDRTIGKYEEDGYEYALVNQNGILAVDPNATYDASLTSGTISATE